MIDLNPVNESFSFYRSGSEALYTVKDILKIEVAPALGCTEPVAIALGAAAAARSLPHGQITSIEVSVDPNIYKNGMAVSIPGSGGLSGLDTAAALGAFGGNPELKLQVLESVSAEAVDQARVFLAADKVQIKLLPDQRGIYIRTKVSTDTDSAQSIIRDIHDNIVSLTLNDQELLTEQADKEGKTSGSGGLAELEVWLKRLNLTQLLELLDNLDSEDRKFIEEGVTVNLRLADYGLKHGSGLGIGKTLERLVRQRMISRDMILDARILTSSASDARMDGVKLPAMSSAGSGNHGLTAILPIWAVKNYVECSHDTVIEAIALSHILTAYVKAHTGRLSAICGCSIAAGAGAAAGITYLLGGDVQHIAGAIKNMTQDLAGVICDGAKAGCSLKLATAAGAATQAALFSLQGVSVKPTDGIIGLSPEQTMQNVGTLSTQGMIETDRTILSIMLNKKFSI